MVFHGKDKVTRVIPFLLFCALLLLYIPFADAREPSRLIIGFTGSAFQEVTNTDIKAAVSVLMQKAAFKHFDRGEARFYENLAEMAADLKSGRIQALGLPVEEFVEIKKMAPLDPLLVTSSTGGSETELVLLARKDSNIRSIWDLKERSIVIPPRNPKYCTFFQVWLESMLYSKGYNEMEDFFSSVKESKTTSKAIMPVFFRQADACVVTRQVLELTAELNPQINRELKIIASKGKLAQGIIAVDRRLSEETKERIRLAFLTLHQTADGEQLLMLFKVKKLIPIPSGYLRETEALYRMHPRHRQKISTERFATRSGQ
jgi:phosphonate transport system substrate-binding protein